MEVSAPCPPLPGRPFYIEYEGGKIYISVHDRWYLEERRGFKRKIFVGHPDRNKHISATGHTRKLLKLRERWGKKEAKWYARFGLEPPEKGRTRCEQGSRKREELLG